MCHSNSKSIRYFVLVVAALFAASTTANAALDGPMHFAEPSAIPTYGPNNYIPTFGDGPGNVFGVEDAGTPDVVATTDLWTLGNAHTTRQEWSDLWDRRINSRAANINAGGLQTDGSAEVFSGTIAATAPGYITTSGNFYAYAGDFTGTILAGNYGGATGSRDGGTFVLFQTSTAVNPDVRPMYAIGNPGGSYETGYDPLGIEITLHDGSPVPGGASILHWGLNFQSISEPSPHGEIPWQENLWTIWMPEWTGDFRIHWGNVNHGAFSAARLDTAIGWMDGDASLENFVIGPPPSELDGDFNHDDIVDAADYVVWRKNLGAPYTAEDYGVWRAHFGESLNTGAGAGLDKAIVIPEPASFALVLFGGAVAAGLVRRRRPGFSREWNGIIESSQA